MMPMDVMPIWTVDKNWVGSSASLRAVWAELLPLAASLIRRDFLAVTIAISDIAKSPLMTIRPSKIKISMYAAFLQKMQFIIKRRISEWRQYRWRSEEHTSELQH